MNFEKKFTSLYYDFNLPIANQSGKSFNETHLQMIFKGSVKGCLEVGTILEKFSRNSKYSIIFLVLNTY